jgi:hypothetical protein
LYLQCLALLCQICIFSRKQDLEVSNWIFQIFNNWIIRMQNTTCAFVMINQWFSIFNNLININKFVSSFWLNLLWIILCRTSIVNMVLYCWTIKLKPKIKCTTLLKTLYCTYYNTILKNAQRGSLVMCLHPHTWMCLWILLSHKKLGQ